MISIINIWSFWIMNSFFASTSVFTLNLLFLQTFSWQIWFLEHSWDVNAREVSTDYLNEIVASKKYYQPLFPLCFHNLPFWAKSTERQEPKVKYIAVFSHITYLKSSSLLLLSWVEIIDWCYYILAQLCLYLLAMFL